MKYSIVDFTNYVEKYGINIHDVKEHDISWKLVTLKDGWIAIFQYDPIDGTYTPIVQASGYIYAKEYVRQYGDVLKMDKLRNKNYRPFGFHI